MRTNSRKFTNRDRDVTPARGREEEFDEENQELIRFLDNDESAVARSLYVRNLDIRVTRQVFYELLIQAGPVESIRILPPRENTNKTIAFIRFEHAVSCRYAILLFNDLPLFRSPISLFYSGIHQTKPFPEFPPHSPTFFEVPPGLEKQAEEDKRLTRLDIIPPSKYNTGYYFRSRRAPKHSKKSNSSKEFNSSKESNSSKKFNSSKKCNPYQDSRHRSLYAPPVEPRFSGILQNKSRVSPETEKSERRRDYWDKQKDKVDSRQREGEDDRSGKDSTSGKRSRPRRRSRRN